MPGEVPWDPEGTLEQSEWIVAVHVERSDPGGEGVKYLATTVRRWRRFIT